MTFYTTTKTGLLGCAFGLASMPALAFEAQDYVTETVPFGYDCTIERVISETSAYVRITVQSGGVGDSFPGGTYFNVGAEQTGPAFTERELAACWAISNPNGVFENLQVNGLDNGGYATDNYIGFSFTAGEFFPVTPANGQQPYVVGQTYEFKVGRGSVDDNTAIPTGPTPDETQAEIASFMQSRANQVIAAQPDLIGLLSGTASGAFNLQATQGNGNFEFAKNGKRNVWARLQGTWSEYDEAETSYTFGVAGAHMSVGDSSLLGVMLQFDQSEQTEGDAKTEGTGFLVGPYLVTKLPNHPLYFEGRLLAGKTANEVNVDGNTPEEFDTTRVLASAKVAGNLEFGALTLTPNLTATHLSETQEAFTDSADNTIAEQSITMTDIALGLDVAQVFALEGGALTLSGGVAAVMSSSDGSGFAEDVVSTFDGERGRVHLGARYALESGMILSAGTSFDGLGSDDFESTSVNVGLQMQF